MNILPDAIPYSYILISRHSDLSGWSDTGATTSVPERDPEI